MQSDRCVVCKPYSLHRDAVRFVLTTVLLMGIAPNLLAQSDSGNKESNAAPERATTDSHQVEPASPPADKEPDLSVQRAREDALEDNQTGTSDQAAPVDFGVMDAPQLKTTVSAKTPEETKITDSTATKESKDQEEKPRSGAPKARVGAQLSIWPSFSIPFGKFDDDRDISYVRGLGFYQVILIGYKISPEFLLGLQTEMQFGVPGRVHDQAFDDEDSLWISSRSGIGVQAQAHLLPDRFVNPWIGYALSISFLSTANGFLIGDTAFSTVSFNFTQISAGADFRFNRVIGFGPFIGFGAGVCFHQIISEDRKMTDSEIEDQALHFQLDIGVRVVFTP